MIFLVAMVAPVVVVVVDVCVFPKILCTIEEDVDDDNNGVELVVVFLVTVGGDDSTFLFLPFSVIDCVTAGKYRSTLLLTPNAVEFTVNLIGFVSSKRLIKSLVDDRLSWGNTTACGSSAVSGGAS